MEHNVNLAKATLIKFTRKKEPNLKTIKMNGQNIGWKTKVKYLGLTLGANLRGISSLKCKD